MSRLLSKQWRMTHLYKIRTKVTGFSGKVVTFNPNIHQRRYYNDLYIRHHKRQIKLKSRKFGHTTGIVIDNLDEVAYQQKNYQVVTMAHTRQKAGEIFNDIIKPCWRQIPQELKPEEIYNNRSAIELRHRNSRYEVTADLKGSTPNRLHISEAAYFENDEDIIEAENSLPEDAELILESTAHGVGNYFETQFTTNWQMLNEGRTPYIYPTFDPWFSDPNNRVTVTEESVLHFESEARELQEKFGLSDDQIFWWDRKKVTNGQLVYQFYPSTPEEAFIHSGTPVFDRLLLMDMQQKYAHSPIRTIGQINIYEEPTDALYGIGVDTVEGVAEGDNGVISVVRRDTGKEVCQVAGKFDPLTLTEFLAEVCELYKNHLCVIERNNHGHTVIAYAKERPIINLYREKAIDKITNQPSQKYGWNTTHESKHYAIHLLSRSFNEKLCLPSSKATYDELYSFVYGERGIMGAIEGKHDDRVIALALANVACEQEFAHGSTSLSDYGII